MRAGICKGCGASIVWIGTTGGKSMPCDSEAVYYKMNASGKDKIITKNGVVITCDIVADPNIATGIGYVPHWSTCTVPDRFRKSKK